jgi:Ca-activated chloride channel family protein
LNRRIKSPVLTDLSLSGDGLDLVAGSLTPAGTVDGYAGVPVELSGRYCGSGSIVVRGSLGDGRTLERRLEPSRSSETALAAIWGRSRIRDLEDAYAAYGDESVAARLVTTSLATGVLCRHTAFVAVDEQGGVPIESGTVRMIQPLPSPSGWVGAASAAAVRGRRPASMMGRPMVGRASPAIAGRPVAARRPAAPPVSWKPSDDDLVALRGVGVALRQELLGDLDRLELAARLLALVLARLRAGQFGDDIDRALRGVIVALLADDRDSAARAADELAALFGLPSKEGSRAVQFWRSLPAPTQG